MGSSSLQRHDFRRGSPIRSYTLAGVLSKMDDDRHAIKKELQATQVPFGLENILRNV
jgi:hypothetical protein